jgi:hypothetical protein
MLSFNNIGKLGRLGNQMFQYAALCGISQKIGTSCCCPYRFSVPSPLPIAECFYLGHALDYRNEKIDFIFKENSFSYSEEHTTIPSNGSVDLYGYFQSEKYFSEYFSLIKKEFTFKKKIVDICNEFIENNNLNMNNLVSLHIRRGDYLNLKDYHPLQSNEYYINAIEQFKDKQFLIFSDDIQWCKTSGLFKPYSVFYSNRNDYEDLYLMTKCSGHIIANSSFSWWGAWLGGNTTIAPKNWFGERGPSNWNDIYCENWIIL